MVLSDANGIAVTNSGASNNTVNITGPLSTSGNTSDQVFAINTSANNNNITLTGDINITGATNALWGPDIWYRMPLIYQAIM